MSKVIRVIWTINLKVYIFQSGLDNPNNPNNPDNFRLKDTLRSQNKSEISLEMTNLSNPNSPNNPDSKDIRYNELNLIIRTMSEEIRSLKDRVSMLEKEAIELKTNKPGKPSKPSEGRRKTPNDKRSKDRERGRERERDRDRESRKKSKHKKSSKDRD